MWEVANLTPTREEWDLALIDRHGKDLHEKFDAATVTVCGLGGLGSNIAIALARTGIGKLLLIDFDRSEFLYQKHWQNRPQLLPYILWS